MIVARSTYLIAHDCTARMHLGTTGSLFKHVKKAIHSFFKKEKYGTSFALEFMTEEHIGALEQREILQPNLDFTLANLQTK